ncbi:MAG: PmeII family type II restriction endonuclease [Gloeomargarita sp. SKYBB_i_bin120]|nr:PmeII family type II restriction endonuclease [Gloeomargarita sp. SKYB120]MDW8179310.1 PmeII family type II restriction endonuclease [Gloeomargarita sp. SKYBB_i_bin120]
MSATASPSDPYHAALSSITLNDFVGQWIDNFHQRRLDSLNSLKLDQLLRRKNIYLFKAKNLEVVTDLVRSLLDAHLSSQEETLFGKVLEAIALFVCARTHNGRKSAAQGIDIEFQFNSNYYIVSVKSGPNWGNHQQVQRMKQNFSAAKRILNLPNAIAVNGCCYGRDNQENKGDYLKLCGQSFWELISNDPNFYLSFIEPLGQNAKEKNEEFFRGYYRIVNRFTEEFFRKGWCRDGRIDWEGLVKFNSGKT